MKITLAQLRRLIRETVEQVVQSENDLAEDEFTYAVAKAAEKGEKKVDIGGEEFPVKMSKEKAKQITGKDKKSQTEAASKDTCPACLGTGMDHNTFADCQECEGSGKL
jgi:DnaJ-class molecular chaperone